MHVSTYCAWSYNLHAAVPATSYNVLMLLYVCTVIYSLAWPDPISRRALSLAVLVSILQAIISLCELGSSPARLGRLCPLYYHMETSIPSHHFCPAIKIFQYICPIIHHMSTNSAFVDSASREYKFKSLDTFLTLKCDNAHYWIVLFFMSYSPLFIQLGRSKPMIHWTWLLHSTEWNTCLNFWDNSVQSPRNNHMCGIQPLEIQTHSSNTFSALFHAK